MPSADQLARTIADLERRLRALERAPQLGSSSIQIGGEAVGVVDGITAGFEAGAVSAEAKAAAEEAYEAAHNIGPEQLQEGAVVFGKIAVGAIGALALKADAIDGKVINGVTVNGGVFTGGLYRTAALGARWEMGSASTWYGKSNTLLGYSGTGEVRPAQIEMDAVGRVGIRGAQYASDADISNPAAIWVGSDSSGGFGDPILKGGMSGVVFEGREHNLSADTFRTDAPAAFHLDAWAYPAGGSSNHHSGVDVYAHQRTGLGTSIYRTRVELSAESDAGGRTVVTVEPGGVTAPALRPLFAFAAMGFTPTAAGTFAPDTYAALIFTAPASGVIKVTVAANIKSSADGANARVGYEIRNGNLARSGTVKVAFNPNDAFVQYNAQYVGGSRISLVSGLTPGAVYNIYAVANVGAAGGDIRSTSLLVEPCL